MGRITKDMLIGKVMDEYPQTREVFKDLFGKGCFTCPGSEREDIEFGAMIHNIDPDRVVEELNKAVGAD